MVARRASALGLRQGARLWGRGQQCKESVKALYRHQQHPHCGWPAIAKAPNNPRQLGQKLTSAAIVISVIWLSQQDANNRGAGALHLFKPIYGSADKRT